MSVFSEESDMTRHIDFGNKPKDKMTIKPSNYTPKAKPTIIKFTSRASTKIKDQYYTIEYGEERQIDDFNTVDMDKEKRALIDDCNEVVDNQIKEIVEMLTTNYTK